MTAPVEPGDASMLVHVAAVSALLALAYDDEPRENARTAADLVMRGACDGMTRADLVREAEDAAAECDPADPGDRARARALRALASYLATLDPPPRRVGKVGGAAPEAT